MRKRTRQLRLPTTAMLAAMLPALPIGAYTGSNGTAGPKWNDQQCATLPTLNNSCAITWVWFLTPLCTGTRQLNSYDRSCGNCARAYFGGCQTYSGRVAVKSSTPTYNCVYSTWLGFPVCGCPGMGQPIPSGTVPCQCG